VHAYACAFVCACVCARASACMSACVCECVCVCVWNYRCCLRIAKSSFKKCGGKGYEEKDLCAKAFISSMCSWYVRQEIQLGMTQGGMTQGRIRKHWCCHVHIPETPS
jgi:hypothetical protein